MKNILIFAVLLMFCAAQIFSQAGAMETNSDEHNFAQTAAEKQAPTPWALSLTTDFAYLPQSDFVPVGNHFAPVTGAFDSLQMRLSFNANFSQTVRQSTNRLLASGNKIVYGLAIQLTPITLAPIVSITYTPIAFLQFSAGALAGTGWAWRLGPLNLKGMSVYENGSLVYKSPTPFSCWYTKLYASTTFMFDLAALLPGKWNHLVTQNTFTLSWENLSGSQAAGANFWGYAPDIGLKNGLKYTFTGIIGYQLPFFISMIGFMADISGYFSGKGYGIYADSYNGTFTRADLSGVLEFACGSKDTVYLATTFASRRSFAEKHTRLEQEPLLSYSGREWFFYRVAVSYTHKF